MFHSITHDTPEESCCSNCIAEFRALRLQEERETRLQETSESTASHRLIKSTFPALSRPARPDRCHACDFETGVTRSDSSPVVVCDTRILIIPLSTTYLMPWIVTDDSAMFVDRITLRESGGVGVNTANCCSGGKAA